MKSLLVLILVSAMSLTPVIVQGNGVSCDDLKPLQGMPPEINTSGTPGAPPAFMDGDDPRWAVNTQVEIWQDLGGGNWRLFARVWGDEDNFFECEDEDSYFLRGNGPGGLRTFPGGMYLVVTRGWNPAGFGPYSEPTYFTVPDVGVPDAPDIEYAPSTNEPNSEVRFGWDCHFVPTQTKIEVRRGTQVVRSVLQQLTDWGDDCEGSDEGEYWDLPNWPQQELPDGSNYTCRVKVYSASSKKWSEWSETSPFEIRNYMPDAPDLDFWNTDFDDYFTATPRPFFGVDDSNAKWHLFQIAQYNNKKKLKTVREQWVRTAYDESIGGGDPDSTGWKSDLPAGEYVWRVLAWNGRGADQSVWSDWRGDDVEPAGPLAIPTAEVEIQVDECERHQELKWAGAPNAYSYQLEFERNGRPFRTTKWLDTAKGELEIMASENTWPPMDNEPDTQFAPGSSPMSYNRQTASSSSFEVTGTAQGWHADDSYWHYTLPFSFPFYGSSYDSLYITSNGILTFDSGTSQYWPTLEKFLQTKMIAIMWADIATYSPTDIKIDANTERVIIVWDATYLWGPKVSISVTLYPDGRIVMKYGTGNAYGGAVGISAGDGQHYSGWHTKNDVRWASNVPHLPDGDYRVRVAARNLTNPADQQVAQSDWSAPVTVNTAVPVANDLNTSIDGFDVGLHFDAPPGLRCVEMEKYQIRHLGCDKFVITDISYGDYSLPPGTYQWRVCLWNVWKGWGDWSDWSEEFTVTDDR